MRPYKAAISFDNYKAGHWYDLDPQDPRVQGLLGAGYLIPTVDLPSTGAEFFNGPDDNVDDGPVPGDDVVVSATPKSKRKVADGTGEPEPDSEDPQGSGTDSSPGGKNN